MKRLISLHEKKQRGCDLCTNSEKERYKGDYRTTCPFSQCPFHVLDKYNSYEEFMASDDSKILVTEFFHTVATVYELSASPCKTKVIFSGGDWRLGN